MGNNDDVRVQCQRCGRMVPYLESVWFASGPSFTYWHKSHAPRTTEEAYAEVEEAEAVWEASR